VHSAIFVHVKENKESVFEATQIPCVDVTVNLSRPPGFPVTQVEIAVLKMCIIWKLKRCYFVFPVKSLSTTQLRLFRRACIGKLQVSSPMNCSKEKFSFCTGDRLKNNLSAV